jgi:hypothetical protein
VETCPLWCAIWWNTPLNRTMISLYHLTFIHIQLQQKTPMLKQTTYIQ